MSVSFIDTARKRRQAKKTKPSGIALSMRVIPFYREMDGDDHYYVNPPTKRLLGPVMPELAWRHGDINVTIGRVSAMWCQDMALCANAYINPGDVAATSYTNVAAEAAHEHLKRRHPIWVVPFVPSGSSGPYKVRGTAISDYIVSKIVLSASDQIATWRDRKATSVSLLAYPHGSQFGFDAA